MEGELRLLKIEEDVVVGGLVLDLGRGQDRDQEIVKGRDRDPSPDQDRALGRKTRILSLGHDLNPGLRSAPSLALDLKGGVSLVLTLAKNHDRDQDLARNQEIKRGAPNPVLDQSLKNDLNPGPALKNDLSLDLGLTAQSLDLDPDLDQSPEETNVHLQDQEVMKEK